ncbi:response regulator transcription factor [Amycolatopsis dongchuanensis]|uniref:LuxR family transcriptional regulator n=1 Tax=Amycolatopsis dongchuanensis TaxID=1070866 RepID=A0ABP8VGI1_9PSEU
MSRSGPHGRETALAELADLLSRTRGGTGGAVEIRGGAGLGKTTLLAAAAELAPDFRVLHVRGAAAEKTLPGAGLHQLATALDTPCDVSDTSPEQLFPLYLALTRALAAAARENPVLCCVDDFPLLDSVSRRGITFCARRMADHAVLLLLAGDPAEHGEFPVVPLLPLSGEASRRLLADLVPDGLPRDLADELVALASGNPLALTELAAALTPAQLAGTAPAPTALPPESRLRARFRRRYEALSPAARQFVRLVVAGERVDGDTVVRAARETGADLCALDEATASGLVREVDDVLEPAGALVRSSLYAELSLADRHATHALLAKVLDDGRHRLPALVQRAAIAPRPDDALADELDEAAATARKTKDYASSATAYHHAADLTAGPHRQALRLLAAARDAWLSGQSRCSRTLLRRLPPLTGDHTVRGLAALLAGEIELRDGTPADGHRSLLEAADELGTSDPALAITALMRAAEATCAAGDYAAFFTTAERVRALARPEEPLPRLMSDHFAGLAAALRGRFDEAREPLLRVVAAAEHLAGCAPKVWAVLAALVLGDDERAQRLATQAVSAAADDGVLAPWALEFLAHTALRLDRYAAATRAAVDGLRLAQVRGQHNCAINHLATLALVAALQGDRATAELRLAHAADIAAARGLARPVVLASWALACLDLAEDRAADAVDRLRDVVVGGTDPFVRVLATPQFVEAAVRSGDHASAVKALEVFESWARSTGGPAHLALSQRCRALLATGEEADERYREALRLHRRADRPFELAKTELFYGERLRRDRKPRDARKYLRGAWQTFQRYEAAYWADRARAELRAAGEAVEHPAPPELDLTPQQAQISKLVAEGATNREIAAQLFLSPRTVEHHLRNIFAKLGIRSRVELTTFFR